MHLWCGNVSTTWSKRLGESTHHYIYISWANPKELANAPARLPNSTNAVSLIQICVCLFDEKGVNEYDQKLIVYVPNFAWKVQENYSNLVFFADSYNLRELTQFPLHAIYTLNNDNYLLPWSVCPWLATSYLLSQYLFQMSRDCKSTFATVSHKS